MSKKVGEKKTPVVKSTAVKPVAKKDVAKKPVAKAAVKKNPSSPKSPKKPVAKPVAKSLPKGARIAIFLDLDNAGISLVNVQEIISVLKQNFVIAYGKLYGYTDNRAQEFEELVRENKFETAGKQRLKFTNASIIDLRLVMDSILITQKNKFDAVFIWAGTGDFVPLFAYLREQGLRTMTADVQSFDCKNKFVDQAIQLYSFASVKPPYAQPAMPRTTGQAATSKSPLDQSLNMQDSIFDAEAIPVLPRKGGVKPTSEIPEEPEDAEVTDEEVRQYLLESARQALEESLANRDSTDGLTDLGAISGSLGVSAEDLPEDNDPFVKELMEIGEFNKPENDFAVIDDTSFTDVGDDFGSLNRR